MKKKIFLCLCAVMMLSACRNADVNTDTSSATETATQIQTELQTEMQTEIPSSVELSDGTYHIEVQSSSSMFKVVDCELTITEEKMTAVMTLSGKGYEKLFMGTSEQAEKADEKEYIFFEENADGKYIYTVPVEKLDTEMDCCAFSIKKQKWYDRKLIFQSATATKKDN